MHTLAFSTSRFSFPIVFKSLVMSTLFKSHSQHCPINIEETEIQQSHTSCLCCISW